MYQLIEEKVFDSGEIAKEIGQNTPLRVCEDMTKRTKRDDALAFKLAVAPDLLAEVPRRIEEEELIDSLMRLADEKAREVLGGVAAAEGIWDCYAYRYDEVEHEILLVAAFMGNSNAGRKLPDVIRRLLTQV